VLRPEHLHPKRVLHGRRDLLVDRKDVGELALVALRPEMTTIGHVDQLDGHAYSIARLQDAALEHLAHVEQLADFANVPCRILELKARRSGDDSKSGNLSQAVDELLGQSITEVLILRVPAHVDYGQHGHPQVVGGRRHRGGDAFNGDGSTNMSRECRDVAPDGDVDTDPIRRALIAVIGVKLAAQASHLHSHDRVDRRVVGTCFAAEHVEADSGFFQLGRSTVECLFDDEP
jgi:hypothetical protein